ncbi:MAG: GNAT family N-acetyltransferase [Bacteroidetes bacterium]|nr:GNAT family N-acetyltransferase [Bacteroidota bacterium]
MITIKLYTPDTKGRLLEIFKSNMPLYFAQEELPLFDAFLDRDATVRGPYSLILKHNEIVGCGGIALNEPGKYTNEPHVIMTWGMVDNKHHKEGLGKQLLLHRIQQAQEHYPGIKIALGTTQHTYPFFEKYGFKTVAYEKDHWGKDLDLYQMELL